MSAHCRWRVGCDRDQRMSTGVLRGGWRCDLRRDRRCTRSTYQRRRKDRPTGRLRCRRGAGHMVRGLGNHRRPACRTAARDTIDDRHRGRGRAPRQRSRWRHSRSTDGGATWHPTIDIHSDVHEVCAHPTHPSIVIAAAAIGLCISRDGGATWAVERGGLHAAIARPSLFLATTFSCPRPTTILRPKRQSTVGCGTETDRWCPSRGCPRGSTGSRTPAASRPRLGYRRSRPGKQSLRVG